MSAFSIPAQLLSLLLTVSMIVTGCVNDGYDDIDDELADVSQGDPEEEAIIAATLKYFRDQGVQFDEAAVIAAARQQGWIADYDCGQVLQDECGSEESCSSDVDSCANSAGTSIQLVEQCHQEPSIAECSMVGFAGTITTYTPTGWQVFRGIMGRSLVSGGIASQLDSPAPGPGDVIGLGIIVIGLIYATGSAIEVYFAKKITEICTCSPRPWGGKTAEEANCHRGVVVFPNPGGGACTKAVAAGQGSLIPDGCAPYYGHCRSF